MVIHKFFSAATLLLSASIAVTNISHAANGTPTINVDKVQHHAVHQLSDKHIQSKRSVKKEAEYTYDEVVDLLRNNKLNYLNLWDISDLNNKKQLLQLIAEIKRSPNLTSLDFYDTEVEGVYDPNTGHDPEVLAAFADLIENHPLGSLGIIGTDPSADYNNALYTSQNLSVIAAALLKSETLWALEFSRWPADKNQAEALSEWIVENKNVNTLAIEFFAWNDYRGDNSVLEVSQRILQAASTNNIYYYLSVTATLNAWM